MYTFDFERNFYLSPDVEKAERGSYYQTLEEFENYRGKVAASADHLLHALRLYDTVLVEFMRHYTYHYLRYTINTTDIASKTICSMMDTEFTTRTKFLRPELISINESTLDLFYQAEARARCLSLCG
jgi:oligoendopeptidase F